MTTQVTIKARGLCYPVHIVKTKGEVIIEDRLLAGGDSTEVHLPIDVHLSVNEEYHPAGYPAK